ncbi:MAG: hypothetical protein EON86_11370, partial [Brevundimonas sp.]
MTDAASRLSSQTAPSSRAAAARTSAARPDVTAPVDEGGAVRRGPFRPEVWLNARQRHASRLAAHYFRAFDVLAVIGLTLLCARAASPGALIHTEISRILPFVLGAVTVLGLLRSLGRYRFSRSQQTGLHLLSVAGVCGIGAGVVVTAGALLRPGAEAEWSGWLAWSVLTAVSLTGLHALFSLAVARWRATGALTPNIVLVGATRHAEALIREALKRRDLNVLGIFDDRLARSPRAIEGVPVLGAADDLLTHKMTPYVDRVVLAIDPRAEQRVRELTARLGALPNEVTLLVEPDGARVDRQHHAIDIGRHLVGQQVVGGAQHG